MYVGVGVGRGWLEVCDGSDICWCGVGLVGVRVGGLRTCVTLNTPHPSRPAVSAIRVTYADTHTCVCQCADVAPTLPVALP